MKIVYICMTIKIKDCYLLNRRKNIGGGGKKRKTLYKSS